MKKLVYFIIVVLAVSLPWILYFNLFYSHGSQDFIKNYIPVSLMFKQFILTVSILSTLIMLGVVLRNRFTGIAQQIVIWITIIISLSSLGVTGYNFKKVYATRFVRAGNIPVQLMLAQTQNNSFPSIAISFWTSNPTKNVLKYRVLGEKFERVVEVYKNNYHWLELKNLKENKTYEYFINDARIGEFKIPAVDKSIRFAVSSDAHFGSQENNPVVTKKLLENIRNPFNGYSIFFSLGDLVHHGFDDNQWKLAFDSLSFMSKSIPTYYALGNHDVMFDGLKYYKDYVLKSFEKKNLDLWRHIKVGKINFIILDLEWETQGFTNAQKSWLIEKLSSVPADEWIIVMSHTFYYCSGSQENGWNWYDNQKTIEQLVPLFEQYKVDIVLSGHQHHSELLQKNGITYVVIGSLGGKYNQNNENISSASIWLAKEPGYSFCDILVDNNTATLAFRDQDDKVLFQSLLKLRNKK